MIKIAKALTLISVVTVAAISMGAATMAASNPPKHPHLRKTVSIKVGEVDLKITYRTVPANEEHLAEIEEGALVSSRGELELSKELTVGETTLDAGKYTVGAIKNGDDDWTLFLYPGRPARGEGMDKSKAILLDSMFSRKQGISAHVRLDLMPGHGELDGKLTLVWHFGSLYLAGALS